MKKAILASAAVFASTASAFAFSAPVGSTTSVPEISALEGTAALAVVVAVVLLAWERRRRAA